MKFKLVIVIAFLGVNIAFSQSKNDLNWHREKIEGNYGVNSDEALQILKNSKRKAKDVIIAVIDTGVDSTDSSINHSFLRYGDKNFKKNKAEKKLSRKMPNKIVGINLLGSSDGEVNIESVGQESFRIMQTYYKKYSSADITKLSEKEKKEYAIFVEMKKKAQIDKYIKFYTYVKGLYNGVYILDSIINSQFAGEEILLKDINKIDFSNVDDAHETAINIAGNECMKGMIKGEKYYSETYNRIKKDYDLIHKRIESLGSPETNPRYTIGDDLGNFDDTNYGNSNLMSGDHSTGTAFTSLIASKHKDIDGVYPDAKILHIRAVPNGDFFDKDIYRSIYYAVDKGAKVILLCATKNISLYDDKVKEALEYAALKDVMVVFGSGSENKLITKSNIYPSAINKDGNVFGNIIRVGASSRKSASKYQSSNYSSEYIDIFAPGEEVSALLKGDIVKVYGSEAAASITTGVVAMVRAYFPKMTAKEIKTLMMANGTPMDNKDMSVSGSILNAESLVKKLLNQQ